MCTNYDEVKTKNFWKAKSRKNKTWIWAYKFYDKVETWLVSYYQGTSICTGWNKSNRTTKVISDGEKDVGIDLGVHVCTNTTE